MVGVIGSHGFLNPGEEVGELCVDPRLAGPVVQEGRVVRIVYLPQPWPQEVTPARSPAPPSPRGHTCIQGANWSTGEPKGPVLTRGPPESPEQLSLPSPPAHSMSSLISPPYCSVHTCREGRSSPAPGR